MTRVAVIGSGPAAFFSVAELLRLLPDVRVVMFERLHAPFGLVRYGVAPDHMSMRATCKVFNRTLEDSRVRWFGGIEVGRHLPLDELRRRYTAVIFCTGAPQARLLSIPGENLPGVVPAFEMVGWYNGHPDFLTPPHDFSCDTAVVIGNGNVAIDLARILVRDPKEFVPGDMPSPVIHTLLNSRIQRVIVLGRRGPVQASFTPKELGEMSTLAGVSAIISPDQLVLPPEDRTEWEQSAAARQMVLTRFEAFKKNEHLPTTQRIVEFRFFREPMEIIGQDRVTGIRVAETRLEGPPGMRRPVRTGREETIACGLVLTSIGYRALPIPGLPFDSLRHVIPNQNGRVDGVTGIYVAGWLKRGPQGLIGNNKPDAAETVASLMNDFPALPRPTDDADIQHVLKSASIPFLTTADWFAIDHHETSIGATMGRAREKSLTRPTLIHKASSLHPDPDPQKQPPLSPP